MSDPASPRARRLVPPRWANGRVLTGVLLVLASTVVGARLLSSADDYEPVWAARHALVPGQELTADDLVVARARLFERGERYVQAAGALPSGYLVTRPIGRGELVPYDALGTAATAPAVRLVSVPVAAGHFPAGLAAGDVVDVYVTVKDERSHTAEPRLVLAAATVADRDEGGRGFGPASGAVAVLLAVPAGDVPAVVQAVESGNVDLVRVPRGAPPTSGGPSVETEAER